MRFEKDRVEWLEYDLLTKVPFLFAATSLRHGGTSEKPFDSLNMGDAVGDKPEAVRANREIFHNLVEVSHLIFAKQQSHSDTIVHITSPKDSFGTCDGLITQCKDLGLVVTHADCQAALFFDPEHQAIGIAHVGWRGLAKNLYANMVQTMKRTFSSKPESLLVTLSPSLCPLHAEFSDYKKLFPPSFWPYQEKTSFFQLWDIAEMQLSSAGIAKQHIENARICTYCEKRDYYSYRRDKVTGRHATVIAMK
jgi:YfiH family protein